MTATRHRFTRALPPEGRSQCQLHLLPERVVRPSIAAPSGRCATTAIFRFHPVHAPASQVCMVSRSSSGPTFNQLPVDSDMYTSYAFIALAIFAVIGIV